MLLSLFQWSDWFYALLDWGACCWFQASSESNRCKWQSEHSKTAEVLQLWGMIQLQTLFCSSPRPAFLALRVGGSLTSLDSVFYSFLSVSVHDYRIPYFWLYVFFFIFRFIQQLSACHLLLRRWLFLKQVEKTFLDIQGALSSCHRSLAVSVWSIYQWTME